jgi:heat-inducible transcriptional repressor
MLDDRKLAVLRAIISDYVSSQEPVGSKALVEQHDLGVSPATIRNDMASLEDDGYITQPHTSAGRIPTDKGYRLFVDRLGSVKPLSPAERRAIHTFMSGALDLDDVLGRTVRLLAQVTQQVAIVQYPTVSRSVVRHVELVSLSAQRMMLVLINSAGRVEQRVLEVAETEEDWLAQLRTDLNRRVVGLSNTEAIRRLSEMLADDAMLGPIGQQTNIALARTCVATLLEMLGDHADSRVLVGGVPNLTRFSDDFETTVKPVLEALEEQVVLLKLLGEVNDPDTITVRIGHENPYTELQSASVVSTGYGSDSQDRATLGIVGPTRMDYPSTMASVRAVARYVGRFLDRG